ncbi:pectate lyase, PelA/Pel-15E family [Alteromonadaceae bacterium Bs31]|nr:pectate lyase, PelA/Pel-15E family [Alteromonadaceae bacterium Bs31]
MGTVYFEKDGGVSGFKSFIDREGKDWIASYLPPGPNGDFRGFPNSVGNFGHAGRDSGSKTIIVDGKTEGDVVILESSNNTFTFQYWFFADHIAIKVLKSKGEYNFLFEGVAGGTADAHDYFVTADGKKHIPKGEFWDFTPEWFYLGDPKSKSFLFLAKTPDDKAPNENHRQIRPGGEHNMDLYSFGRTGKEHKYKVQGMSGNEHTVVIGFAPSTRTHPEMTMMIESFLAAPFSVGAPPTQPWRGALLNQSREWYSSIEARLMADTIIQGHSAESLTPPAVVFLAHVAQATGEKKYQKSFKRHLDYLISLQYPSGGWPKFSPLPRDDYRSHVSFNKGAMLEVLYLLRNVADAKEPYRFVNRKQRKKARAAIEGGIDFIIKSQFRQNGKLTAWCAQHDEKTLEPAWANADEPPTLSGRESVEIVRFLMANKNPSPELIQAVESAVSWFKRSSIKGRKLDEALDDEGPMERKLIADQSAPLLWARFYELESNRPLYLDQSSVFRYNYNELEKSQKRTNSFYGTWADSLLNEDYPIWREKHVAEATEASTVVENEGG